MAESTGEGNAMTNTTRYVLTVAELTLWASDVLASKEHAADVALSRSVATAVSEVPELEAMHPWAWAVLGSDKLAADAEYIQSWADRVITHKVHLPPDRPLFEEIGDSEPENGGDVGGDIQEGDSLCRRFAAQVGAVWAVVTVYFYTGYATVEREGPLYLYRQDEFVVCTNPRDPGTSELAADQREYRLDITAPCEDDVYDHCADLPLSAVVWLLDFVEDQANPNAA